MPSTQLLINDSTSYTAASATLLVLASFALANCGGKTVGSADSGETSTARTGYTNCASGRCSPGQYCSTNLVCLNGCVSDLNCLSDAKCVEISSVSGEGVCESSPPTTILPPRDATCDSYAAHAQECGLLASEAEAIRQVCDQLDVGTKQALAACNASESCAELLSCSGLQCFNDGQCPPASPDCVTRDEVVDPLDDVLHTCR